MITTKAVMDRLGRPGPATLAAEIFAAWQGASYIRTHDVAATRDALTTLDAITGQFLNQWPPGYP